MPYIICNLSCLNDLDDAFDWLRINVSQNMTAKMVAILSAAAVFTCTYHGLIFGLIFNKRIIFSPAQFILDKASSLIAFLDLDKVLIGYTSFEDKIDWDWDYVKINKSINTLKEKSLNFLKDAIGVIHE